MSANLPCVPPAARELRARALQLMAETPYQPIRVIQLLNAAKALDEVMEQEKQDAAT